MDDSTFIALWCVALVLASILIVAFTIMLREIFKHNQERVTSVVMDCPFCGQAITAFRELSGMTVNCPHPSCAQEIFIPQKLFKKQNKRFQYAAATAIMTMILGICFGWGVVVFEKQQRIIANRILQDFKVARQQLEQKQIELITLLDVRSNAVRNANYSLAEPNLLPTPLLIFHDNFSEFKADGAEIHFTPSLPDHLDTYYRIAYNNVIHTFKGGNSTNCRFSSRGLYMNHEVLLTRGGSEKLDINDIPLSNVRSIMIFGNITNTFYGTYTDNASANSTRLSACFYSWPDAQLIGSISRSAAPPSSKYGDGHRTGEAAAREAIMSEVVQKLPTRE